MSSVIELTNKSLLVKKKIAKLLLLQQQQRQSFSDMIQRIHTKRANGEVK